MNSIRIGSSEWTWRFSSCEKKKRYPDEQSAKSMAGQQRKKSGQDIQHYKCHFCPSWHIGHTRSSVPAGPKLYCPPCDVKIPQANWDKHFKKNHRSTDERPNSQDDPQDSSPTRAERPQFLPLPETGLEQDTA